MARGGKKNSRGQSLTRAQRMEQRNSRRQQDYEEQEESAQGETTTDSISQPTDNSQHEEHVEETQEPPQRQLDINHLPDVVIMIQRQIQELHKRLDENSSISRSSGSNSSSRYNVNQATNDQVAQGSSLRSNEFPTTSIPRSTQQVKTFSLKPTPFTARGNYDVDTWVSQFRFITGAYDEKQKKALFVESLRDHALDWFVGHSHLLENLTIEEWLEYFGERFAKSPADKLHELKSIRWQPGDNPREFVNNVIDKANRIGVGVVQPQTLNMFIRTMLKSHPQYDALVNPNFPDTIEGIVNRLYYVAELEQEKTKAITSTKKSAIFCIENSHQNDEEPSEQEVNLAVKQTRTMPQKLAPAFPKNPSMINTQLRLPQRRFIGVCFFCNKPGHRERDCFSKQRATLATPTNNPVAPLPGFFNTKQSIQMPRNNNLPNIYNAPRNSWNEYSLPAPTHRQFTPRYPSRINQFQFPVYQAPNFSSMPHFNYLYPQTQNPPSGMPITQSIPSHAVAIPSQNPGPQGNEMSSN